MSANYREPQFLLPNCKNLKLPGTGTSVGSGLTEDRHSLYSMDFDGNSYIDITNDVSVSGDCTVSFWFRVPAIPNSTPEVMFARYTGSSDTDFLIIGLYLQGVLASNNSNLAGSKTTRANVTLAANTWYHCAVTKVSGVVTNIYINGTDRAGSVGNFEWWGAGSINSGFIGQKANSDSLFDGKLDEVAIFSRALSTSEITTLYNNGSPSNPMLLSGKPVAYYPLGEQARNPNGNSDWRFPNEVLQGQAIDFNGTDYIEGASTSFLNNATQMSFSVWFNLDTAAQNKGIVDDQDKHFAIYTKSVSGSNYSLRINLNGSANRFQLTGTPFTAGKWHNLLMTFNAGTLNFYIDGSPAAYTVYSGSIPSSLANNTGTLDIGRYSTLYWDGKLSNIAIWNTDQSANKDNIYNYGSPQTSYTVTPTAWYKLDKTSKFTGLNPNWHNALSFDGSNQINFGNDSSFNFTGGMTVSGWVKGSAGSGTKKLILKDDLGSQRSWQMNVRSSSSNFPTANVRESTFAAVTVVGTKTLLDDNWHHFALVFTPSTSLTFFIDGEEAGTETSGLPTSINVSTSDVILAYNQFAGEVSNFAIYDQVISPEDIKYLYNGGTPQTNISFEPVSWWKLDDLTTGIQDSGSANNNGTATGSPSVVTDSVAVDEWVFDNAVQSQTPNWSSALEFTKADTDTINYGVTSSWDNGDFSFGMWFFNDGQFGLPFTNAFDGGAIGFNIGQFANGTTYIKRKTRATSGADSGQLVDSNGSYIDFGFEANKWQHIGVSHNTSTNKMRVYANGKFHTEFNGSTHSSNLASTALFIGARSDTGGTSYAWEGELSNIQVFNSVLLDTEFENIYNNGSPLLDMSSFTTLTHWWKLDNTTTGIQDSIGSLNGTNNGATEIQTNVWTPRLNGESDTLPSTALVSSDLQFNSAYSSFSLDFDGASTRVLASNPIGVGIGKSGQSSSVSFWFNLENINAALYFFMFSQGTDSSQGAGTGLRIYWTTNDDQIRAELPGGGNVQTGINSVVDNNTWFHYVLTVDHSNTTAKVYLNGKYKAEASYTETATDVDKFQFIGSDQYNPNSYEMLGMLDECAVFNKVLNQAEITSMYNNGYPADLTSLAPVSWWRLGEDAYYNGTDFIIPNKISGAPNSVSIGMGASALVANAPGSYAAGLGSSLALDDRVGDAPLSTANSLSFNMTPENRISYVAGYAPSQVDNVYSMAFDGNSDYVNAGTSLFTDADISSISISCWIKTPVNNTFTGAIVSKDQANSASHGGTAAKNRNFLLQLSSGSLFWQTSPATSGTNFQNESVARTAYSVVDGNWHNIVVTYKSGSTSGTAEKLIYIDGELKQTTSQASLSNISNNTSVPIEIGRRGDAARYFDGNIDEVAIFDYVLSAKQIKEDIYNATTSGKTADLNNNSNLTAPIAWYRMGD